MAAAAKIFISSEHSGFSSTSLLSIFVNTKDGYFVSYFLHYISFIQSLYLNLAGLQPG
jgi:hypothetical protein